MENASKALIIGGTILISILLISVGILVLNSTSGIKDESNKASTTMAVSTFNTRFTQYFGDSVSASQVKTLIRTVMANNSIAENRKVQINLYDRNGHLHNGMQGHNITASQLQTVINAISSSSTYKIFSTNNCSDPGINKGYDSNGYIHCISIKLN